MLGGGRGSSQGTQCQAWPPDSPCSALLLLPRSWSQVFPPGWAVPHRARAEPPGPFLPASVGPQARLSLAHASHPTRGRAKPRSPSILAVRLPSILPRTPGCLACRDQGCGCWGAARSLWAPLSRLSHGARGQETQGLVGERGAGARLVPRASVIHFVVRQVSGPSPPPRGCRPWGHRPSGHEPGTEHCTERKHWGRRYQARPGAGVQMDFAGRYGQGSKLDPGGRAAPHGHAGQPESWELGWQRGQALLRPFLPLLGCCQLTRALGCPYQDRGFLGRGGSPEGSHPSLLSPGQDDGVPELASHAGHMQVPAPLPGR